jgi:hypothetical protein
MRLTADLATGDDVSGALLEPSGSDLSLSGTHWRSTAAAAFPALLDLAAAIDWIN